jgi:hypothetical protein
MMFFLNRGLILEQEIVKALKSYFSITGVPAFYENFTVSVSNRHPFARMVLSGTPEKDAASLFPVVVVTTEYESKPDELANVIDFEYFSLGPQDIEAKNDGGPSDIEARYLMMTPKKMDALREAMNSRTDKRVFGAAWFIRRSDHVSIEIWADNPQLKNELYELVRLFVCGYMKESFEKLYDEHNFSLFDDSVKGQRSNNFNFDFGVELYGAQITFDADYIIEQSVIDTELVDGDIDFMEVINHAKGQSGTSRSVITGGGDCAEPGEKE